MGSSDREGRCLQRVHFVFLAPVSDGWCQPSPQRLTPFTTRTMLPVMSEVDEHPALADIERRLATEFPEPDYVVPTITSRGDTARGAWPGCP